MQHQMMLDDYSVCFRHKSITCWTTDGKGTRHLLEVADHLLAKLSPMALVVKYEEHTHAGEWSHAENSLRIYVQQGVRDGWPLDALMRTGVHPTFRTS